MLECIIHSWAGTHIAVRKVSFDKELGMLPEIWFSERKLHEIIWKNKWKYEDEETIGEISQFTDAYNSLVVIGKFSGILPPMWLLLRFLFHDNKKKKHLQ